MKLFISYRRSDSTHAAQRVRMCLQAQFGSDAVFIDRDIPPGADWKEQLEAMLKQCTGVIVLIGDAFLRELRKRSDRRADEPDWLEREIEIALGLDKPIYPVLIGAIDMPEAGKLPENIRRFAAFQAVFAREPAFDAAMAALMKSIAADHRWVPPAAAAAAPASATAGLDARSLVVALLAGAALLAVWLVGRVLLWLAGSVAGADPEPALWAGTRYALATLSWGLGPYLAWRAVAGLRARARLPVHNLHSWLTMCNLGLAVILGASFVLLSTRSDWALRLWRLIPEDPTPWHFAGQGLVLLAIVFAALATAMLEPRVRQLEGVHRLGGISVLNTIALAVTLALAWFGYSLWESLPPVLRDTNPVPLLGYALLTPALSGVLAAWDYSRSKLGFTASDWTSRALLGLAVGLHLTCTLAYFAYGPLRLLIEPP